MIMIPKRALILVVGCLLAGMTSTATLAQDKADVENATDKVEDVVEERADEENAGTESEDANVGEASYNTEDCAPADGEGDGENEDEGDADGDAEDDEGEADGDAEDVEAYADADADADADGASKDALDDCEKRVK